MGNLGKRELSMAPNAAIARQFKERLQWLLSDQLLMVVSALLVAAFSLAWLGLGSAGVTPPFWMTAATMGFLALALVNALLLPFQIWELQSSALEDELERAYKRLNDETRAAFKD